MTLTNPAMAQDTNTPASPITKPTGEGTVTVIPRDDGFDFRFEDLRGVATDYKYNTSGKLTSEIAPEIGRLDYHYDDEGRVSRINRANELTENISYDAQGRVVRRAMKENGEDKVVTRIRYDNCDNGEGRVCRTIHNNHVTRYAYTENGHIAKKTVRLDDEAGAETLRYTYFSDGRLDRIYYPSGLVVAHNRTNRTEDGQTRSYHYAANSNRLNAIGNKGLDYDSRGNLLSDLGDRRNFVYDATNRMVEFHKNGELRATYDYDAQGHRIRKQLVRSGIDGVKSVRFVYDSAGQLLSETSRRDDRSAIKARDLIWLDGLAVAQIDRRISADGTTRNSEVLSLHTDHLGAPREARDADGEIVWKWRGDAFGAGPGGRRDMGIDRDPDGDGTNTDVSLRFPGQYHDRESNLFYNHHRDYDPATGRYIQSDPIGLQGGVNRYVYVRGDPINKIAPTGLEGVLCTGSRLRRNEATSCEDTVLGNVLYTGISYGDFISGGGGGAGGFGGGGGIAVSTGGVCSTATNDCLVEGVHYTPPLYTPPPTGGGGLGGTDYAQLQIGDILLDFDCFSNSGLSFCERKKRYLYDWMFNPAFCQTTGFAHAAYKALDLLDTPGIISDYSSQSLLILEQISAALEVENNIRFTQLISGATIPGITDSPDGIGRGFVRYEQAMVQVELNNLQASDPIAYNNLISESNDVLNGILASPQPHLVQASAELGPNVDLDFADQSHRELIGYESLELYQNRTCRTLL
ncbi:RHS repeat domain-containing protein [Litorimonas haliclonae]|uniref:RHS repeat domain-containing protein n=1 Tax=Litorimonas haliclonae TaxID=2081977 RepID=UPI0039EFE90D